MKLNFEIKVNSLRDLLKMEKQPIKDFNFNLPTVNPSIVYKKFNVCFIILFAPLFSKDNICLNHEVQTNINKKLYFKLKHSNPNASLKSVLSLKNVNR